MDLASARESVAGIFEPTHIRFIKLGRGGKWEQRCIEEDQTLRLGYDSGQHAECLRGDWDAVRNFWLAKRNDPGAATRDVTQVRDFYELPETTLWITFYGRKLYWCFADAEVRQLDDGSRVRDALGSWSCASLKGETLHLENIDGRVTKVQGFRGTVCSVQLEDYLVRKIRGEELPEVAEANERFSALCESVGRLIQGLWWHDFELLADLVFVNAGWQRVSVVGKTEKEIDLDLLSPVTGRRAFVQVKSKASLETLKRSIAFFKSTDVYDEMYFVVHTTDEGVLTYQHERVHVVGLEKLSELAINAGLMRWLINKCR